MLSHSSGGQKSKIKMLAELVPFGDFEPLSQLLVGARNPWHSLPCHSSFFLDPHVTFSSFLLFSSLPLLLMFIYFWETERDRAWAGEGRERERHRIQSRLQALSCQHRAWCRARTHEPWDHDLSWSRMLNQLSHPPSLSFLLEEYY